MTIAIPNLTGLLGDVQGVASGISMQDVLTQVVAGTVGTVALAGVTSSQGQDAIDPLHLFHKDAVPATANAAAVPAVSGVISGTTGNVMTMSTFQALSPDAQKTVVALKYTIIPG